MFKILVTGVLGDRWFLPSHYSAREDALEMARYIRLEIGRVGSYFETSRRAVVTDVRIIPPESQDSLPGPGWREEARWVKEGAETTHREFPQYEGHWDGWIPVRVVRTVRTKMGVAFLAGDVSLMRPEDPKMRVIFGPRNPTVYSFRNKCDTSVPFGSVEILGEPLP